MISSGLYNDRVAVLRSVLVTDGYGAQRQEWKEVRTTWARVQWKKGWRALDSGEAWNAQSIVVTMRYRKDLNARLRLRYAGRTYAIESINSSYQLGETTITATLIDEADERL